ncbi:MATE family efflux transporter [Pandoraea faecigallinarum]|uniref:MATE family efflux transporter n=1 Tax=Pandoraea faecigallinarum TaxID=656179 RepID=A0A0H3WYR6_9BURK|nr:MATE family efflux transporter [Pandoraea faecigallinarum]AKM31666.1 MATE family efflux transporter [Pandoraea faecigallinarum]
MNPAPAVAGHRQLLRLAVPIVLANLTQPLLSAVDTAVAGHLPGPAYLGGVALGGLLLNLIFWGFSFLRMGTTGLAAQAYGARDAERLRDTLARALALAFAIGTVLLVLRVPLVSLGVSWLGGSDQVQALGREYASIRILAAPFALGNYVVLGYLLACQRVRQGLAVQVFINVVNIVAVLAFVSGFGWGVSGIARATALADALGFGLGAWLLWLARTPGLPPLRFATLVERSALWRLLRLNLDIFLRTLFLQLAFAWFARVGARLGDTTLAANALLLNFQTFMAYGLDGFAHAAEALVGAYVGARQRQALLHAIRLSLGWALGCALAFALVYALAGGAIIDALTDQPVLRETAREFLPWAVLSPIVAVWCFQLDGVFIGATRTRELLTSSLIGLLVFGAVMPLTLDAWGNHGLWVALMAFLATRGIVLGVLLPRIWRGLPRQAA